MLGIVKGKFPVTFFVATLSLLAMPGVAVAAEAGGDRLILTDHFLGLLCVSVFVLAYLFVIAEEFTHLSKSKPVLVAAGLRSG